MGLRIKRGGHASQRHPHFCLREPHHAACCNPSPLEISKTGAGVGGDAQRARSPPPPRAAPGPAPGRAPRAGPSPPAIHRRRLSRGLACPRHCGWATPRAEAACGAGGGARPLPKWGRAGRGGSPRGAAARSSGPPPPLRLKCRGCGGHCPPSSFGAALRPPPGRGGGFRTLDRP